MSTLDAVELTRELIQYDTRNPPGDEHACAGHLAAILEEHGFVVERREFAKNRTSLVAYLPGRGAGRPLCFTGHIDTVPLGAAAWSVDPFSADEVKGKLFGRGSSDMKSGVAAFVVAAIAERAALAAGPGLVLVITAGEETGCEGARYLAENQLLDTAGAIVVAEPSSNYPFLGHKGVLWLRSTTTGVTAHGSMPERGVNAAYKAARMLTKLEHFDFKVNPHPVLGKPTLNVGTVASGMNINSVPDHAELTIDVRTIPEIDHASLKKNLGGYLAPELETLEPLVELDGIWTEPESDWVADVWRITGAALGEDMEPRSASYFTDASVLTPAFGGAPTIVLGPGEAAMAHQTDEYCLVDHIPQAVSLYRQIASAWVASASR